MAINDPYVNLSGFLEGSSELPMKWRRVELASQPQPKEWSSIEYFQLRAREFLQNVEDLRLPKMWSLSIDTGATKAKIVSNLFPGRHRAKSLYLDFRHFTANDEPSRFPRVVNSLRKNLKKGEPIDDFLVDVKDEFTEQSNYGMEVNGQDLSMSKLIEIWFNTEYFHAGRIARLRERQIWLMKLEADGAQQLLFWAVLSSVQSIKSLYACVKDMHRSEKSTVNCPDPRIIYRR